MEFQYQNPKMRSSRSAQPNSDVGSDRLRKAIERNRAKNAKRESRVKTSKSDDTWSLPKMANAGTRATRKSVAKLGDSEFVTNIRKSPRRAPATVSYAATKTVAKRSLTTKRRVSKVKNKLGDFLHKGIWFFCGFLILRLIFSSGGVLDFYSSQSIFDNKISDLKMMKEENLDLIKEIDLIKNNSSYQKKLVRDQLGFISGDEFLILFPKEKS